MRRLRIILAALAIMAAPLSLLATGPQWEQTQQATAAMSTSDSDKVEVVVRDGYIYLTTQKPVTVKVMSIVGQLISEQTVPAGTHRLKITSKGIYILKAGGSTVRVTV